MTATDRLWLARSLILLLAATTGPGHALAGSVLEALAPPPRDGEDALGTLVPPGRAADDGPGGTFLPASQAFQANWGWVDANRLVGRFTVAPGYYLYRDRLRVLAQDRTHPLAARLALPTGDTKDDPYFGPMQVLHQPFEVTIDFDPLPDHATRPAFDVVWQGCAEAGLCYPPQRWRYVPPS